MPKPFKMTTVGMGAFLYLSACFFAHATQISPAAPIASPAPLADSVPVSAPAPAAPPANPARVRASSEAEVKNPQQLWLYDLNVLPPPDALYRLLQAIREGYYVRWDGNIFLATPELLQVVCSRLCSANTCLTKSALNKVAHQYVSGSVCLSLCYLFGQSVNGGCRSAFNTAIPKEMDAAQKTISNPNSGLTPEAIEKTSALIKEKSSGYQRTAYNEFVREKIEEDRQDPSYKEAGIAPPPPPPVPDNDLLDNID